MTLFRCGGSSKQNIKWDSWLQNINKTGEGWSTISGDVNSAVSVGTMDSVSDPTYIGMTWKAIPVNSGIKFKANKSKLRVLFRLSGQKAQGSQSFTVPAVTGAADASVLWCCRNFDDCLALIDIDATVGSYITITSTATYGAITGVELYAAEM